MSADAPIGVFDSGVGGLSVLKALREELPDEHFVYFADAAHAPYGERGEAYVVDRSRDIIDLLLRQHAVKAAVVACNTATAAAIHLLRAEYPALALVGLEPALKPAAILSRTRRIGVMATRGTLGSAKVHHLHDRLRVHAEFILQPCDGLADAIQNDDVARVAQLCGRYVQAMGRFGNAGGEIDTLVLGCTHYPFALHHLQALLPAGVHILETGSPVARQTRRLLQSAGRLRLTGPGTLRLCSSGDTAALEKAAARWL